MRVSIQSVMRRPLLLSVVVIAVAVLLGGCASDSQWRGRGPAAATSLQNAPALSLSQRVRGRIANDQPLYVHVDPSARGRYEYAIDGVGNFDVEQVLTSGKHDVVTAALSRDRARSSWLPAWLTGPGAWGHGGQLGDVEYFIVRPHLNAGSSGAYEFTVYQGPSGYQP